MQRVWMIIHVVLEFRNMADHRDGTTVYTVFVQADSTDLAPSKILGNSSPIPVRSPTGLRYVLLNTFLAFPSKSTFSSPL